MMSRPESTWGTPAKSTRRPTVGRVARLVGLVAGPILFASSCVKAKQDSLTPKGRYADIIYDLVVPIFAISGVVAVVVLGGTLYFSIRYRVGTDEPLETEAAPPQMRGNAKMELGWTILPALILLGVGIFTVSAIFQLYEQPPKENPHVEVIGQQWWWEFRYDLDQDGKYDEIVTANELVIPAGADVALRMDSRDVIHGLWVPELQGKRNANPGHPNDFNIQAHEPGIYYGQCSVMCGLSHATMRMQVHVLPQAEYDEWVEHQQTEAVTPTSGLAKEGAELFEAQCGSCHNVRGIHETSPDDNDLTAGFAPDLTHFMSRTSFAGSEFSLRRETNECIAKGLDFADDPDCIDEAKLRAWLHDPEAMLPMYAQGLNDKDGNLIPNTVRGMPTLNLSPAATDQLVAFLTTLK